MDLETTLRRVDYLKTKWKNKIMGSKEQRNKEKKILEMIDAEIKIIDAELERMKSK